MGLGLSLGMYQQTILRQDLRHKQKLGLKHILTLSHSLKGPKYPYATKGMEGLIVADEILKEKEMRGLLIGGVAKSIWNRQRKPQYLLDNHKDVDVAVLDLNDEKKIGNFEGGIDWFFKNRKTGDYRDHHGDMQYNVTAEWLENPNKIMLNYGLELYNEELEPGLYFPCREFIKESKKFELMSKVDTSSDLIEIDDEVLEVFENETLQSIGTCLPKFITERFKSQILDDNYNDFSQGNIRLLEYDIYDLRKN